jgi:hypothetical protein
MAELLALLVIVGPVVLAAHRAHQRARSRIDAMIDVSPDAPEPPTP